MTYLVKVPFEVMGSLPESDPDVRSVSRLPGFVHLELIDRRIGRYELTVEVEGGSIRDAADAAEELLIAYEDALAAYHPRRLAAVNPALR
jgi:hypothetical protein